jgi:condensin complex subunit 3
MAPKPTLNLEDLYESIANIFDQAQVSLANHKKNCVALYKLHTKAATISQPAKKGNGLRLVGEKAFQDVFIDMVNRVLIVKKGPANADRIVKYVGSYVKFMNEKGMFGFTPLLIFSSFV